jgi:ABC-type uncharacterized transport system auxiliary subunit
VQRLAVIAVIALVAGLLAGCGSSKKSDTTPPATTTAADNTIYERAYTECASTSLSLLAGKYHVASTTPDNVAKAVGAAWSDRYGGGDTGTRYGEAGCHDGFNSRGGSSKSA